MKLLLFIYVILTSVCYYLRFPPHEYVIKWQQKVAKGLKGCHNMSLFE